MSSSSSRTKATTRIKPIPRVAVKTALMAGQSYRATAGEFVRMSAGNSRSRKPLPARRRSAVSCDDRTSDLAWKMRASGLRSFWQGTGAQSAVWIQRYDPLGDWRLSTAVAAVPVLLLLGAPWLWAGSARGRPP